MAETTSDIISHLAVMLVTLSITRSASHMDCKAGYYYDTGTNKCDPCTDICTHTKVQMTRELCQQKCPDWSPDLPKPPLPTPTSTSSLHDTNSTLRQTVNIDIGDYAAVITLCGLVGLVIAISAVVIICLYGQRLKKALVSILMNRNCTRRGVPPHDDLQETTPGLLNQYAEPTAPPMEDEL